MSQGWENHEPSPIEFFHARLMEKFHKFRTESGDDQFVELDGMILNNMIAETKRETYDKYQLMNLDKAVLKSDLWNKERVNKAFDELGFMFPTTSEELEAFNKKFEGYPYNIDPENIDPQKIIDSFK